MCQFCEDFAAGLIDAVTADACLDETPYVPDSDTSIYGEDDWATGRHNPA